ncbi:MAG: WD40 repeat domain-containing protein [Pirellulaceae bacterium]|nr:WD40 repeat domain-containing protein [Planctomycetales bacterium]
MNARHHVGFSNDGQWFLVGLGQRDAEIRSMFNGELTATIIGPGANLTTFGINSRDQSIATGYENGTVIISNPKDGTPLKAIHADGPVTSLSYSLDGKWLAVARRSHGAEVYEIETWAASAIPSPCELVHFSPDSNTLFVADHISGHPKLTQAWLYRLDPLQRLVTIARHPALDIELSPNGRWALGRVSRTPPLRREAVPTERQRTPPVPLPVFDVETGRQELRITEYTQSYEPLVELDRHHGEVRPTRTLTAADYDAWGRPITMRHGDPLRIAARHIDDITKQLDSDGTVDRWLRQWELPELDYPAPAGIPQLVLLRNGGVSRPSGWNTQVSRSRCVVTHDANGSIAQQFAVDDMLPTAATMNLSRTTLYIAYRSQDRLKQQHSIVAWDLKDATKQRRFEVELPDADAMWDIESLILSPNQRYLAITFHYDTLLYDLETQQYGPVITRHGFMNDPVVQFSPDSQSVFCYGHERTLVRTSDRKVLVTFGQHIPASAPIFSPNGRFLLVATSHHNSPLQLCDTTNGQIVKTLKQSQVIFSDDGTRLVHYPFGTPIPAELWDFQHGSAIGALSSSVSGVISEARFLSESATESATVVIIQTGRLAFFDATSGKLKQAHAIELLASSFGSTQSTTLGQQQLLTLHPDGVRLWDHATGELANHFPLQDVHRLQALPIRDNSQLLTVTSTHGAKLWDLATYLELHSIPLLRGHVEELAEDGKLLERCRNGQRVRIWDVDRPSIVRTLDLQEDNTLLVTDGPTEF